MISLFTTKFKQSGNDSTSDNFMQDQVDLAHHTSKETDAPIIILFKEKKTEPTSSGNTENSKT